MRRSATVKKNSKVLEEQAPAAKRYKLFYFPKNHFLKNLIIFFLFILFFTQTFLMFYFYSIHIREDKAINNYKEALKFILREGGGFSYSICNKYITPADPSIVSLANELKTPKNAFNFLISKIGYRHEVAEDLLYPFVILNTGYSNCVGQANLLASLLLAQKNPPKNVWVTYGSIVLNKRRGNHAWVEYYFKNRWIVLDPTLLTYYKGFEGYEKSKFYNDYQVIPVIRYNDRSKYFVSY